MDSEGECQGSLCPSYPSDLFQVLSIRNHGYARSKGCHSLRRNPHGESTSGIEDTRRRSSAYMKPRFDSTHSTRKIVKDRKK